MILYIKESTIVNDIVVVLMPNAQNLICFIRNSPKIPDLLSNHIKDILFWHSAVRDIVVVL